MGYLAVRSGDRVEVLYEGARGSSEEGWIFASLCDDAGPQAASEGWPRGWLPSRHVLATAADPPGSGSQAEPDLVPTARGSYTVAPIGEGYLAVSPEEPLQVLYCGSQATGDEGWLFACRCRAPDERGWVPGNAVKAVGEDEAEKPWWCQTEAAASRSHLSWLPASGCGGTSGRGSKRGSRAQSSSSISANGQHVRFRTTVLAESHIRAVPDVQVVEFPEPKLSSGQEVLVVEIRDAFAKVEFIDPHRRNIKGWILAERLADRLASVEPESEPLPLPPHQQPGAHSWAPLVSVPGPSEPPQGNGGPQFLWMPPEQELSWAELGAVSPQPSPADDAVEGLCAASPGRVEIVTFGLENLDGELSERCAQHPGGGATIRLTREELREALGRTGVPSATLVIDARYFPDPHSQDYTRHTGVHHEIIKRICQHRNFESWLAWVKRQFTRAHVSAVRAASCDAAVTSVSVLAGTPPAQSLTLAVYCRSGKHRSVAAATILSHVLRAQGWACPPPRHLSKARWGKFCCRGLCEECLNPPAQLQETLDAALRAWHRVGGTA